jgi:hypothetical protein
MPITAKSAQQAGFAVGITATAPEYLLLSKSFADEASELRHSLDLAFGDRDNRYGNPLVGWEDTSVSITIPVEERVFPIILGSFFSSDPTTGTSPNFVNTLKRGVTGNERKITLFLTEGDNGIVKYTGAIASELTITTEKDQVNAEVTFTGGTREILTGTPLTTANNGFTTLRNNRQTDIANLTTQLNREATFNDYYKFVAPSWVTLEYSNNYNFSSSTVVKADYGFKLMVNNNVQGEPTSLSAAGNYVQPDKYYGSFSAGFEFTAKVLNNDLKTKAENNTPQCFRIRMQNPNNTNRYFSFVFNSSEFQVVSTERVGNSDDAVTQTVMVEKANNNLTNQSLVAKVGSSIDLTTIF